MPRPTNAAAPSFGQTVKDGFAFGIGHAIANRLFGPSPKQSESSSTKNDFNKAYDQCLKEGGDHDTCKQYLS